MVNLRGPVEIDKDCLTLKALWHLVDGFFIWEFLITLDYEWNIIRGRRRFRWTIWIYSLTRVATLAAVGLNIFSLDVTTPINCQDTIISQFTLAYLALAASSLLIVLRIIAIWDRKRVIVAIVTGIWGINIASLAQGVWRFHSAWGDVHCVDHLDSIKLSTIVPLVTDIILLLIMLFGLSRMRRHGVYTLEMGRLLWNQGVAWLLLAVAELLPTVFICLNLNQPFNLMFQVPWAVTMSIGVTRMYRSLSDFLSSDISQPQEILPTSDRTALENSAPAAPKVELSPIPLTRAGIQIAVHTDHELHSTPQANRFSPHVGWQPHGRPHRRSSW
ncbi:hypothetical protein DFH94DRAFT_849691 [Russula ochroleuca]|uniref:Uncharacterized protein n=1 Tax=Russula ochroleuca TaxID=152965 RepID=A0A9P5TE12_9AGAM|nr:hypothetical protein DFH94DRAFT_849691 [Russula ochroleuca]